MKQYNNPETKNHHRQLRKKVEEGTYDLALSEPSTRQHNGMAQSAEAHLVALAIFLEHNGNITMQSIANKCNLERACITQWYHRDNWNELLRQKLACVEVEMAKLSAEFCAKKLAEIHTADLARIASINHHVELSLKQATYIDDDGEERTSLNPFQIKALAEASQWNVRSVRIIMGKEDPTQSSGQAQQAGDLMNAISNAWKTIDQRRREQQEAARASLGTPDAS